MLSYSVLFFFFSPSFFFFIYFLTFVCRDLIDIAIECDALDEYVTAFSHPEKASHARPMHIDETLLNDYKRVVSYLHDDKGSFLICGGAQYFAPAIERLVAHEDAELKLLVNLFCLTPHLD